MLYNDTGDIMKEIEGKIIEVINKLRPYLIDDGGDIEFIKFEDGIAYVHLSGACSNCHMMDYTLKEGIETVLIEEIPEVKKVINV